MRRMLSVLLAVCLLAAVCPAAFAEGFSETYDEVGLTLDYPGEFQNTVGIFIPYQMGMVDQGIFYIAFDYAAMTKEEYEAFDTDYEKMSAEEIARYERNVGFLCNVFAVDSSCGIKEIMALVDPGMISEQDFTELGRAEGYTFYLVDQPEKIETFIAAVRPEYTAEVRALHDSLIETLKKATFFAPRVPGGELTGQLLRFETTDVDGKTVSSEELFAAHEITMLNIWATWCGPCVGELEALGEMHRRLAEKDVAVVGICFDADEELETCKALLAQKRVDYLNLLPFADMDETLGIEAVPTSFFVGRDGRILAAPFVGAPRDMSSYEDIISALLDAEPRAN